MTSDRIILPGHLHVSAQGAVPFESSERLSVTLLLRPRVEPEAAKLHALGALPPGAREHLSREAFAETHGAEPAAVEALQAFAKDHGLEASPSGPGATRLRLSGPADVLGQALGLRWGHTGGHRVPLDEPSLPAAVAPFVKGILGLDARPKARPHVQQQAAEKAQAPGAFPGYTAPELAAIYGFPDGDGAGQCAAVIELGGGYDANDMATYFQSLGLSVPDIVTVSVDGQTNNPTGCSMPERQEVTLDLQVLGALVPKAKIIVYFAPNTGEGLLDALDAALHDTTNKPSVISMSWGGSESGYSSLESELVSDALQSGASMGVTVLLSSGDFGSSDQQTDGKAHVNFPASSPWVLACGGTTLEAKDGARVSEKAWNDQPRPGATGGGVSDSFDLPDWQKEAGVPASVNDGQVRRGVPDLAANADMDTGYRVCVAGQFQLSGGTSAVAPLMAGLVVRLNAALGKPCGYLNPLLYTQESARAAFLEITEGNNGAYQAGPGYNACTGLGVVDGAKLLAALSDGSPESAH